MQKYHINNFLSTNKIFIFAFLLVFCIFPSEKLYSLPPQKQLQPGDWAYDAIAILSREQGKVFFIDSRVTVAQMEKYLEEIDIDSLSESGLVIYDRLAAYLKSEPSKNLQSDALSIWFDVSLQPEAYYKSNENNLWIFNDHARSPILQLPWGFSLGPWITAEMELYFGQNEYAATLHDNYVNIPLDPVAQADIHFPRRAYVSVGSPISEASGVNLAIGIGDNFYGRTRTGSIIISEYLERTIYAQASIYSPFLKYTAQVLQYEVNKYQYMHYIQIRPHRTFSFSVAEGVMVNAPLELRFLNPFIIFHSYESYKTYDKYNEDLGYKEDSKEDDTPFDPNGHSRIGSYLGVKLEYQPINNFRFYGLFVMDVLNLPMKKTHWMEGLYPDAIGFQAGTEFSFPVNGGYWEFGLEGVYTYPYLYIMWGKGWSFYKEVPELDTMEPPLRYWTGTPFGPDTIAGTLWAGFRSSTNWYSGFSFTFSAQGERSPLTVFDHFDDNKIRPTHLVYDVTVPPSGDNPIYTYTATLRGEYSPNKWLTLTLQPGYRVTVNTGHIEDQIDKGFELAFSLKYTPFAK
jgi:hypothetical protein